jgi:hypothetical protein
MPLINSWAEFKTICITRKGLAIQFSEVDDRYIIIGPDKNGINWFMDLFKQIPNPADPGTMIPNPDAADFVATVMPTANGKIDNVQMDSDGAPMSRTKVAPSGWNFQFRGVEFATSTLSSVVNKDATNTDLADATLKLYKADGTLVTDQADADANCVKTQLDIEPPYDIYIAGGKLKFIEQPVVDVRIAVIGVPDVPVNLGGSKHFVQNVNLKFIPAADGVNADGRAAKWLQYSATYHTNKIRFLLYHPAGHKMPISTFLELYRQ